METTKISIPARRYVALRHKGAYNKIGAVIGRLFELAQPLGIEMMGAPAGFWYSDPKSVPEEELESAAALPVATDFEIEHDELFTFDIPAGEYFSATFYGPYEGLDAAWDEFTDSVRAQEPNWHICFEEYVNDCAQVAPEEIETRFMVAAE